jgi:hypothetical protein
MITPTDLESVVFSTTVEDATVRLLVIFASHFVIVMAQAFARDKYRPFLGSAQARIRRSRIHLARGREDRRSIDAGEPRVWDKPTNPSGPQTMRPKICLSRNQSNIFQGCTLSADSS